MASNSSTLLAHPSILCTLSPAPCPLLPAPRFFPNHKSHRNLGSFVTTVRMGNLINIQDKYAKLCFPTTLKKLGRLYIHFLPSQKEEHYLISFRSDILSGRESSANKSATWHLPFGGSVANKVLVLGQPAAANEEDDFIVPLRQKKKKCGAKKVYKNGFAKLPWRM